MCCLHSIEPGHAHKRISGSHHVSCTLSKPDPSGTDILAALANEKLLGAGRVTDATGRQTLDGPFENVNPLAAMGNLVTSTLPPAVHICNSTDHGSYLLGAPYCHPKDVY